MLTEPTSSPIDSGDPVLQVRMGIAVLASEDRSCWAGYALSERLVELLEIRERLDAEVLRLVGSWDRDRAWEIDGALSPRAWLAYRTPVSESEAGRLVKNARLVDSPDGARTLAQRRADGLVDIIHRHINGGVPGGNPPNVVAVVDVAELTGMSPQIAMRRCEIEGIGPVTRSVIEQIRCDARFTRSITAGKTQVLDMGRSVRVATPPQRRALAVRDRHCRFPSCRRRPQWCDAHHVAGWVESSSRQFGCAKLQPRHRRGHNSRWTITRTPNGDPKFTHPTRGP